MQTQNEQGNEPERRPYYITTAIDYSNAAPHIGHALEKVAADVVARYHRLLGDDTFFSGGVDENSQHVALAADARGVDRLIWINQINQAFLLAWSKLHISYDYWIRTTEERHVRASVEMYRRAQDNGDIYLAKYTGYYCPNCNTFYDADDLIDGHCPDHPSLTPEWLEEENYFFSLSKYGERLLAHIQEHPEFIVPASRRAEIVAFIKRGLRDFSISRQVRPGSDPWGIPVPDDPQQVIYVWFDALTNYLTAVGFPDDTDQFTHYWPADAHVIGKDITRFHCIYWPAMLLSAGLPLPKQVPVHGFTTLEGQRISKTLGNTIDPVALVDEIGADAVRYALTRNLSFASDGDFSRANLLRRYNDELGNDLGNLLNRVVSMIQRYRGGVIPRPGATTALEDELQHAAQEAHAEATRALDAWEIGGALNAIWVFVKRVNQYVEQSEPWKLARKPDEQERLDTVLYAAAESLRLLAILLAPFIPSSCDGIQAQLGLTPLAQGAWSGQGSWGRVPLERVVPGPVLFPRLEA